MTQPHDAGACDAGDGGIFLVVTVTVGILEVDDGGLRGPGSMPKGKEAWGLVMQWLLLRWLSYVGVLGALMLKTALHGHSESEKGQCLCSMGS